MTHEQLTRAFRAFAAAPSSALEGALLVGQAVDAKLDADWCRAELARLAAAAGDDAQAVVAHLHAAGFTGADDYYVASNSSLEYVLRQRRGIPISLAVVLMAVAEQRGLSATGINFPRHFLVAIDAQLVDPFRMQLIDRASCRAWLEASNIAEEGAFQPAGPRDVVLRMLNNVRMLALGQGNHARVLELSDYQLAVAPDPFAIHLERVDSWLALGVPGMARHEIEQAMARAPNAAVRAQLAQRLTSLADDQPRSLH